MKNICLKILLIVVVLLPLKYNLSCANSESTQGVDKKYLEETLDRNIKELQLKDNKVSIIVEPNLFVKGEWAPKGERLLEAGDTLSGPPSTDDSFSAQYVIKKIEEDGIFIEYESITDEVLSGGKVTIDKGEIKLKWKRLEEWNNKYKDYR